MSERKEFIDAALRLNAAKAGTIGWHRARHDLDYFSEGTVRYFVLNMHEELQRLRSEIALRDRCIAWCLDNGASRCENGQIIDNGSSYGGIDSELKVPAEFAAILGGKADSEVQQ